MPGAVAVHSGRRRRCSACVRGAAPSRSDQAGVARAGAGDRGADRDASKSGGPWREEGQGAGVAGGGHGGEASEGGGFAAATGGGGEGDATPGTGGVSRGGDRGDQGGARRAGRDGAEGGGDGGEGDAGEPRGRHRGGG